MTEQDLDPEIAAGYQRFWTLPDGRLCGLRRLLYHWTVQLGITDAGYEDR